ncbi:hypothetical protein GCM10010095_70860 [Streptomyces anthocyanicus]|uniref:Uncharacterized protein n=1 Tax=Streptomyces violaceolatus TaxID=67378 RepID=A0ABN3TDC2_9ACTN|nr:hypothetical protein GCM10010095_70860 [Streptomyces anthocyanicus]
MHHPDPLYAARLATYGAVATRLSLVSSRGPARNGVRALKEVRPTPFSERSRHKELPLSVPAQPSVRPVPSTPQPSVRPERTAVCYADSARALLKQEAEQHLRRKLLDLDAP